MYEILLCESLNIPFRVRKTSQTSAALHEKARTFSEGGFQKGNRHSECSFVLIKSEYIFFRAVNKCKNKSFVKTT